MHAYKAITTKFLPAGNVRGARIKAIAEGRTNSPHTVTIPYPHDADGLEAHGRAAAALCEKLNWSGELIPGALYDGNYVWVFKSFEQPMTKLWVK